MPTFRSLVAADIPALGANPSQDIGLSAVNGSATTYLRSDGAPALDQGIAPTWTAGHIFAQSPIVADDIYLYFGDDQDASIQYDTNVPQFVITNQTAGPFILHQNVNDDMDFYTNNTKRMEISGAGKLSLDNILAKKLG